jgi:glycosyltransferase involved in cell wall biosynthesis
LIFSIHNLLSKDAFEINKVAKWVEFLTYRKKQLAIGVSDEVLKDYNNEIGLKGEAITLYNFFDEQFMRISYVLKQEINSELKLIAVGNLRRQKNYMTLLRAFQHLASYNIILDIYGTGDLKDELNKFISANHLKVRLMGSTDKIEEVLPNYDAFIMSSHYEGFSLALIEAMAVGLPIIISDVPVIRELTEDKALYFSPDSANDIARAIKSAYTNWGELRDISRDNKSYIQEKASRSTYLNRLKSVYK